LPTHFTIIDGIEPIYSGGKISLNSNEKNEVSIYSSYNFTILKTLVN